jgi:ribosome-binding ATPase YchF (GTP1/OBG family)/predicted esterase
MVVKTKLKVLCLHGKRQDGEIFSQRLAKLTRRLEPMAEFIFVDAPFELELEEGQTVPMRSWWRGDEPTQEDLDAACAAIRGSYAGVFDGIIGFSQGAALGSYLTVTRHSTPPTSLANLKFVIVAGSYAIPGLLRSRPVDIPSLHIMSMQDTCVNYSASQDLVRAFQVSAKHVHELGHCLPVRLSDLDVYHAFVQKHTSEDKNSTNEATEEQREEFEAIQAIFMDDVLAIEFSPPALRIAISDTGAGEDVAISLRLPPGYPESEPPEIKMLGLPRDLTAGCVAAVQVEAEANSGVAMLFQLVNTAREWLQANATAKGPASDEAVGAVAGGAGLGEDSTLMEWIAREEDEEEVLGAAKVQRLIDAATDEAALADASLRASAGAEAHVSGGGEAAGVAGKGGIWKFTVGLVGKPSAGKSTLFNAIVSPDKEEDEAKVGAFPFTTIDPNLGQGFHSVPAPAAAADLSARAAPSWGVAEVGGGEPQRLLPLHVLDVAGLVPGAYKGRGHGNAFLNDLCSADVLVHVVDASGATDAGGNLIVLEATGAEADEEGGGQEKGGNQRRVAAEEGGEGGGERESVGRSGPVGDVRWVREEIHRWIYNNLKAKWPSVVRGGPDRLIDLLSGYQQSRALSGEAVLRAGMSLKGDGCTGNSTRRWQQAREGAVVGELSSISCRGLHRIVAHFLRVRFPMVLACNKMDHAAAAGNLEALRAALPTECIVPLSALAELSLIRLRRAGQVEYRAGGGWEHVRPAPGAAAGTWEALEKLRKTVAVLPKMSSGVLAAVNAAVALRSPLYVYPVANLDCCTCEGPVPGDQAMEGRGVRGGWQRKAEEQGGEGAAAVLRDCMMLRPGSSVFDVYEALKRPPWNLVAGDFVRAEARVAGGERRPLKKTELVVNGSVLKIFTNKKARWQNK